MVFYLLKNTKKDFIMIQEDEEDFDSNNICRFCEKKDIKSDKVRDHCHLTGKYRRPAHNTCDINVQQKHSQFTPLELHNFSNYIYHIFLKKKLI